MKQKFNIDINFILKSATKKKLESRNDFRISHEKTLATPQVLLIASYPPRECGIATYTYDLKNALDNHFEDCFSVKVCAIESESEKHVYDTDAVECILNTDDKESFTALLARINSNKEIELVMIQHEFGLFHKNEESFIHFMEHLQKPIIVAFHTILPEPNNDLKKHVQKVASLAKIITVMTKSASEILVTTYGIAKEKIEIISHGTHLVEHGNINILKEKYGVLNRKVISTFGFLGPGKNIETTLEALPSIIKEHQDILFLIVGKTHPTLYNQQGDAYRESLKQRVAELQLENYVRFVNKFVPLPELLNYLQLSDCYIFTSKDPNQAVSGTFSYAVSCGCPIVSTPIPHAKEVLNNENGVLFNFGDHQQLAEKLNALLNDRERLHHMKMRALHISSATSWENAAIAHGQVFSKQINRALPLKYKKPKLNFSHLTNMTTEVGIVQFSKITTPDLETGYTLDDNARAFIAASQHYKLTQNPDDFKLVSTYLYFILKCQRQTGLFLNYLDKNQKFTVQNSEVNLEDSNGRAIWALGYVYDLLNDEDEFDYHYKENIKKAIYNFLPAFKNFHSPRAIGFALKGLYYFHEKEKDEIVLKIINEAAQKLLSLYKFNTEENWQWFEPYLTYANSVLPEALLFAWKCTGEEKYKNVAKHSFDFLLSKIFTIDSVRVISNQNWLLKGSDENLTQPGGEQPIDVAYTILALQQFSLEFPLDDYDEKAEIAFSWFLGNNHLKQIVYNYCTGGCHDGIEKTNVNLNQGAESTVSYLLARLSFEKIDD